MTGGRSRFTRLAATVGAALALAACGSTPLSVTQLRSSATRICQLAVKQGNRIAAPASPAASASFLRRGVPILTRELASLRALQPPSALSGDYRSALSAFSQQLTLIQAAVRRLDAGADPVITFKLLQSQLAPIESRGAAAWQALGVPSCVNQ